MGDVWVHDHIKFFEHLAMSSSCISPRLFFRYLQLCHALTRYQEDHRVVPEYSLFEPKLIMGQLVCKELSRLYRSVLLNTLDTMMGVRAAWEWDMGELGDDDWNETKMAARIWAVPSNLTLIQFNYLQRIYWSLDKI